MKIHIANYQPNRQGGGWSFANNFAKAFSDDISDYNDADVYFIVSPSMVAHEDVEKAKRDGKKIVLRVDNIVRNSRNRNTGMSRMKAFADVADVVVYQSEFSKELLGDMFLKKKGVVIHNACDTSIFNDKNRSESTTAKFVYSRVNRDETKNWEMARFIYSMESAQRKGDTLLNIVGAYSPELVEYNFDFYMDEAYKYWGVVNDPNLMANIYRDSDYLIYTFWNDACSNTLIEALCCGCQVIDYYGMVNTGGSEEIMHHWKDHGGNEYFGLDRMKQEYKEAIWQL